MLGSIYADGRYAENNPDWHLGDSEWKAGKVANILDRNSVRFVRACEVGCGAGGIVEALSHRYENCQFDGYEKSPQAFALCEQRSSGNLRFMFSDLTEDMAETYDVMLVMDVFEHVDDYIGFLRALKEKADKVVFHIPLDLSVQTVARARPIMAARERLGHLHYFNKETALATLDYAGYRILDYELTSSAADCPGPGFLSRVAAIPRRIGSALSSELAARYLGGFSLLVLAE